jgi:molecular chaperone DnaK (HSP70)
VFENGNILSRDNHFLASFGLSGILLQSDDRPQIKVTFVFDANSTLKIFAIDSRSRQESRIKIKQERLFKDEIERMIVDGDKCKKR